MWPGLFLNTLVKRNLRKLILIYFDSSGITYPILSACFKSFIFQERLCLICKLNMKIFLVESIGKNFSSVTLHKLVNFHYQAVLTS